MEDMIDEDMMIEEIGYHPDSEIAQYFEKLFGEGIFAATNAVDEKNFALLIAVREGNVKDVLQYLIQGADVSYVDMYGDSALHIAARLGHLEVVNVLITAGALDFVEGMNLCSPLHVAAGLGHTHVVKALIKAGAFLEARDYDDEKPIHYAARRGHADCVAALAAAGVDLDTPESIYFNTALHQAVSNGHVRCVRVLIDAGADVNVENHFRTKPLHSVNNPKIVVALAEGGASVNARDSAGCTPLNRVVARGSVPCVRALLRFGADPSVPDKEGKKPLERAKKHAIRALLLDRLYYN